MDKTIIAQTAEQEKVHAELFKAAIKRERANAAVITLSTGELAGTTGLLLQPLGWYVAIRAEYKRLGLSAQQREGLQRAFASADRREDALLFFRNVRISRAFFDQCLADKPAAIAKLTDTSVALASFDATIRAKFRDEFWW